MAQNRFKKLKEQVLGKSYDLSLVFASDSLMRKLNKEHRGKDKASNVLSFVLEKDMGEVFFNIERAKKEAKKYDVKEKDYLDYLFVHCLLHLKGYEHGKKMDEAQEKILGRAYRQAGF